MTEKQEIEQDLQELKHLLSTAKRKRVQQFLQNHISSLERQLTEVFYQITIFTITP